MHLRLAALPWREGIVVLALGALMAFQVRQLLAFHPYWGYDGGAHVQYLDTLFIEKRFPTIEENYLAWHEPLYYLILVAVGHMGVPYDATHLAIVFAIDVALLVLLRRVGLGPIAAAAGTVGMMLLPPFQEVGLYYTNEALNYFFLILLMLLGISVWRRTTWSWKSALVFAVVVGFALLTKVTALVAFGVCAVLLVVKSIVAKDWRYLATVGATAAIAALMYMPWMMTKSLPSLSINNYNMLTPKPLAWDERVDFLARFDTTLFEFPFWYAGAQGFWSMLYADTVSDYYGLFENQLVLDALPKEARVRTTHNGTFVSAYRKPLAQLSLVLGAVPMGLFAIGVLVALWQFVRRRFSTASLAMPTIGFVAAFFLALLYHALRYPYYDQGVVKSIFIAPAFVLPIALALSTFSRTRFWMQGIVYGAWAVYSVVVVKLFWVAT